MTADYPAVEIALLRAMAGDAWSPAQTQRYTLALSRLESHIGRVVVREMALERWRPSPMDILRKAARVVSPFPDSDLAFGEMIYKARTAGIFGRQDPERPNVYLLGPPPFTHALVGYPIFCLGGWQAVCEGEAGKGGTLKAQYRDAYNHGAEEWVEDVAAQLQRVPDKRDPRFFRQYVPFIRPVDFSEDEEERLLLDNPVRPAVEPHSESWLEAREEAKRVAQAAFARIGARVHLKRLPAVTVPDSEPLTAEARRDLEAAVRERARAAREMAANPDYIQRRIHQLTGDQT